MFGVPLGGGAPGSGAVGGGQRGVSAFTLPRTDPEEGEGVQWVPGAYLSPPSMALTSSPLLVSPLNSQKKAPPSPWLLAHAILLLMVAGVS